MALRKLTPELEELAKKECNEEPARLQQDLQHIRDWLAKQPHLKSRTDDQFLTMFLRGCKFSLERTKAKLDMYHTLKTALPEFYTNRDPMLPEIQHLMKLGVLVPLPEPDDQGRRVAIMRQGLYDPNKIKIQDVFKFNMMLMDVLLEEDDRSVICGTVSILDHDKMTMAHMMHFSPSLAKKGTTLFQEGYPIRPKAMHHINFNSAFTAIFNMFKSFMKEKLQKRLHMHSGIETMFESVPKRILPLEYGGEAGPIDKLAEEWKKKVEARRDWLIESEKYGCNEKKRPGKPKTHEDLFGLEGSFRQLNVD
ncbi:retinol-binding protein pinta-like [Periplaneta americana]|uniref:retinol-binding protein pinta-like n=1 Tax=Periplaneta americana TaxID=6978 RepID=UPI0037E75451